MRLRRAAWPVLLACALALLAAVWARRVSPARAHPQLYIVAQLYRVEPPRLKDHGWKYDKAGLPSLKIDHPTLKKKPWWERPREEWQAVYDSWPQEERARIPEGVAGMEEEIERLRSEAETRVAPVTALSEEEMVRYVPPQSPIPQRRNYCPACGKGKLVWVGPAEWDRVRCPSCRMVFPNDEYPADKVHAIKTPTKKDVEFRYHRDERSFNHFFEAVTYEPKRQVALLYAKMFAEAYYYTGKEVYARRVALILERFATVFPDWCMTNSEHPLAYVETPGLHSGGADTNFNCGRWAASVGYEAAPSYEYAYDLAVESEAFDRLSEERGRDVREFIERYLFYENMAVYYSGGWEFGIWGEKDHISQIGIARKAWVLNSADTMHRCRAWAERLFCSRFHYDGMPAGTTDDHASAAELAEMVVAEIQGWSDPPGYKHYLELPRMEDFDRERHFPLLTRSRDARKAIAYPDGRDCPSVKSDGTWSGELGRATNRILPGWGHAVLGSGSGEGAVQAHLHFSGDYGMSHRDNLSAMLFAFGREMLPDIGYHESDMLARWTISALSHNTVVVDRRSQGGSNRAWDYLTGTMLDEQLTDCDLEIFVPGMPGLAVVMASGERAYPPPPYGDVGVEIFRRMQVLVTVDPERPYVVDVFHVKGGSTHDYILHGSCDHPMSATASVALADEPLALLDGRTWPEGAKPREWPVSWVESYGLFRNVRRAGTDGGWTVSFTYRDRPDMGVRIHMTSSGQEGDNELFLAESPSSRRLLAHPGERVEPDFLRPSLLARRKGEAGLESLYVAVIEPFRNGAAPMTVERLEGEAVGEAAEGKPIALRVGLQDRTDTLLLSWGAPGAVRTADGASSFAKATEGSALRSSEGAKGGAELIGILGFVSEVGGIPAAAYLVGGTRFRKGDVGLSLDAGAYEGGIAGSLRVPDCEEANAFVATVDQDNRLPEGDALRGSCMILTMGRAIGQGINTVKKPFKTGYLIDRADIRPEGTWVHTLVGDHGLRVGDRRTEEACSPKRTFLEYPAFIIHRAAHEFVPAPSIAPAGGFVPTPLEIEITCEVEDVAIRYTVDGSEPTGESPAYAGPFALDRPAVVKARAFRGGWGGAVSRAVFTGALLPTRKDATGLGPGLDYEYWEVIGGSVADPWDDPPLRRGAAKAIDRSVAARETEFALRYRGYMQAPTDGVYEFSVTSEGPSSFAIGDTVVARRDLNSREPLTVVGRAALKAGVHRVVATYVSGGEASRDSGARGFSVRCLRPRGVEFLREGGPDEIVAARALRPAVTAPAGLVPGVVYRYYEDEWRNWPVFDLYSPVKSGVAETVGLLPDLDKGRAGPFALVVEGYVDLPADGEYTFYLNSRDECRAYVDGDLFVLSRGWNGQAGTLGLRRGLHTLRVEYVKSDGELARGILNFDVEGPGVERRALGPDSLRRPPVSVGIEPGTGPITGPVTVKLIPERGGLAGLKLRYTLDGTEPTRRSREYAGPISVSRDTVLKARACLPGVDVDADDGPVAEAVYTAVPPRPDVYVSDLAPAAAFSTAGEAQKDRNGSGRPISVAGRKYEKGLGVHAYSEVTYELKPEYARFVAVVGVDDEYVQKKTASVEFVVYVDDEPVHRSPVLRPGQLWHVNAAIPAGGRRIKLVVDGGPDGRNLWKKSDWKNLNVWDYGDWAEAGFALSK